MVSRSAHPLVVVGTSWMVGSIPLSWLAARTIKGVDLRQLDSGTVSGSGLYKVAGKKPLVVIGCLELASGALGPLLAGRERPGLARASALAAICGHNWSPWLAGAGGRGLSTAMGAGLVLAPESSAALVAGLGLGKLAHQTGLGCALAMAALYPLLSATRGRPGRRLALCLLVPLVAKRLMGNAPPDPGSGPTVYMKRLVFDRDGFDGGGQGGHDGNRGGDDHDDHDDHGGRSGDGER